MWPGVSPTFTLWKWSGEKTQLSSAGYCNYISSEYVCKERKKLPGCTNCLNLPKARKNSLGHLCFPQLNLWIFTLILKASITHTNAVARWQHCQGRIITATADSELLLTFTTSSPPFFCLAEFLALTASLGNKFYPWATTCIKKHLTCSRPVAF